MSGADTSMFDFEEALRLVSKQTILCVGDVMLDDFVYGEVTRISPEAPTPVLRVRHNAVEIGGAGNVARNIAALGATCVFVGLIGDDEAGFILQRSARQARRHRSRTRGRQDTADDAQSAFRLRASFGAPDAGRLGDRGAASAESQSAIIASAEAAMPKADAVVLSDYAKGVLTERVIRAVIERRAGTASRSSSIRRGMITGFIAARR